MEPKQILGKRIQDYRKLKGLTQEKLAEIIGIDTVSLSKIETGKNYPTSENLSKITKVLNVELYQLFVDDNLKSNEELLKEINTGLKKFSKDNIKLHVINALIKSL